MLEYYSDSLNSTKELGMKLAKFLKQGDVVILSGDLGTGKTVFVSGFLSYYGKENEASSPTFTIVNEHHLIDDLFLYHFDVYRFDFEDEFTAIGGEEFFYKGICIIEWGEKIKNLLPPNYLEIKFERDENDALKRHLILNPVGERYASLLKEAMQN